MKNIELFNLTVAEVLGMCYENFPERIDIKYSVIADKVLGYYDIHSIDDQPAFLTQLIDICTATITWLEQAGFIWVKGRNNDNFYRVTLSSKGLELLNLVPDSLTNVSIGESFIKGTKSVAKETVLAAIKLVLSEGTKLLMKGAIPVA